MIHAADLMIPEIQRRYTTSWEFIRNSNANKRMHKLKSLSSIESDEKDGDFRLSSLATFLVSINNSKNRTRMSEDH